MRRAKPTYTLAEADARLLLTRVRYKAPSFMCSALQQSKPTLSWDADDTERSSIMKRDLSKSELREVEYASRSQLTDDLGEVDL